IGGIRA
ncbi:mCG146489, partial [Mus musculus]